MINKLKWRLLLLKEIILNKKFKFLDIFYFFLPQNALKRKKIKEELESFSGEKIITKKESDLYTFNFCGFAIRTPPSTNERVFEAMLDFGVPVISENKGELSYLSYLLEGPYEFGKCLLESGDIVMDVGSNLGLFSMFASSRVGGGGAIYAFEPVSKTKEFLERNVKDNDIKNCVIVDKALGDTNKEIDIFINDNNLGGSSIGKKEKSNRMEKIDQITLDDFVAENNIEKVDFIKADIEGAERNMLVGAEKTIKRFKPKIAVCTYHLPDDPEVLENILKDFVPEYNIVHKYKKMYAWIEK